MIGKFTARLQYALPHHLLTALAGRLARWRFRPWSAVLIRSYRWIYGIDMSEAATDELSRYPHFNAFFTRALRPGARPWPGDADAVGCPADGTICALGTVTAGELLQVKGRPYRLAELLGDDELAWRFDGGAYLTVYLSPRDYHRVHMPVGGELESTVHLPGRLFSVAPSSLAAISRLFCRNERLACLFRTDAGSMAQIMVGAMLVGGIETVWHGTHGHPAAPRRMEFEPGQVTLQPGDDMGRFNLGSTVMLLFEAGHVQWREGLLPGDRVQVGQPVGRIAGSAR